MDDKWNKLKDSVFNRDNVEKLKESIILIKNEEFSDTLFKKMLLSLYNNNEEVKVIYTYETKSCEDIKNWAHELICGDNFIPEKQFLSNVKMIVLPEITLSLATSIVNFDTNKKFIKMIIEGINQKIPIYISFSDGTIENSTLIQKTIEVKNELKKLSVIVSSPSQLAQVLNIRGYENITLDNVKGGYTMDLNNLNVAKYIDHTLLKPQSTYKDIDKLCDEAKTYKFKAVCVNSYWTKRSKEDLSGSGVLVATVIGFPLGAMTTSSKAFETRDAVQNGSDEIDMVINIGELKAGNYDAVQKDIEAVVAAANGKTVKVIIETCLLTDEEKVKACLLSKNAKAHFVKTSTGFSTGGATLEDIYLMRQTVGKEMGVKAAGGIRDFETAVKMIENGATRIGTSSGIKIVTGEKGGSNERY